MKKLISYILGIMALLTMASVAFATANPSGTGQPNQSCQAQTATPAGFLTSGFTHAATVYAGSTGSASLTHSNSQKAVSQYDVACFQLSSH